VIDIDILEFNIRSNLLEILDIVNYYVGTERQPWAWDSATRLKINILNIRLR